jgi:hypothetical protein
MIPSAPQVPLAQVKPEVLKISGRFIEQIKASIQYSIDKIFLANLSYSNPEKSLDIVEGIHNLQDIQKHLTYILVNKHLYI